MKLTIRLILFALVVISAAQRTHATPITGVLNGGFEAGGANWTVPATSNNGMLIQAYPGPNGYATIEGVNALSLDYDNYGGAGHPLLSGAQQDLGEMIAGETYTLNATIGSSQFITPQGYLSYYSLRFVNVEDNLLLSEITDADFDVSLLGDSQTMAVFMSYTAGLTDQGDTLRLILEARSTGGSGVPAGVGRTSIDAVSVTVSTVPEPSTWCLLVVGLAGLTVFARTRRP